MRFIEIATIHQSVYVQVVIFCERVQPENLDLQSYAVILNTSHGIKRNWNTISVTKQMQRT